MQVQLVGDDVLLQRYPDRQVKAVFYMSKELTKTQQVTVTLKKKLWHWLPIIERFRKFLYDQHFFSDIVPYVKDKSIGYSHCKSVEGHSALLVMISILTMSNPSSLNKQTYSRGQNRYYRSGNGGSRRFAAETELQQLIQESGRLLPKTARKNLQRTTYKDEILTEVIDRLQTG